MIEYERVARGFDVLAPVYDVAVEPNPLHALLRRSSLAWLEDAFPPGHRVLEVGCGTGTEAVYLTRRGVRVVATDISPAMAAVAAARVRAAGLAGDVEVLECAAGRLPEFLDGQRFDGAYASLGALNCEPDLGAAVDGIARLLRPDAPFLASVVSRPCAAEIAAGVAGLHLRTGFRRMADRIAVDLYGRSSVAARAYSESELREALGGGFEIVRLEGLLVTLPPPYLFRLWDRVPALHGPLERLDARVRGRWPFRGWGDHLHVWARRRSG